LDFNENFVFQLVSAVCVQIWSGVGFPFIRNLRFAALISLLVSWFFLPFVLPLLEAFLLHRNFAAAQSFSLDLKVPASNSFLSRMFLALWI
jgi:hypothetical protein